MALKKVETAVPTDKVEKAAEVEKAGEKDSRSATTKPSPDKVAAAVAVEKEKDPPPVAAKVKSRAPKPALVSQNSQSVPSATSSTLVISYGNGKVRSTLIEPDKKSSSGKRSTSKTKDVTRPRIVRDPDSD